MQRAEVWERRRKPRPKAPPPPEAPEQELFIFLKLMGRMIRMALETDSTRIVPLFVNPAQWVPRAPGVWAMPTPIPTPICRCRWPAAGFAMQDI